MESGERIELVFKCITFREFDPKKENSDHDFIKSRIVDINLYNIGTGKDESIKLEMVP